MQAFHGVGAEPPRRVRACGISRPTGCGLCMHYKTRRPNHIRFGLL